AFKLITVASLCAALLGFASSWSIPLAAILALIHGGLLREYSHLFHTCLVPIQIAIVLALSRRSADALSIDSLRARVKPPQQTGSGYAWTRYFCWIVVAAAYTSAGLSKICNCGFDWWHGENLKYYVMTDTLGPMQFEWGLERFLASVPLAVFSAIGILTLLFETGYFVVLLSRRARRVIPFVAILFHLGVLFCHGILFFDLLLIPAVFVDWSRFAKEPLTASSQLSVQQSDVRWHRACALFLILIGVSVGTRTEWYPITSWQMYSTRPNLDELTYHKIFAIDAEGRRRPVDITDFVPALADTRYRNILRDREEETRRDFFAELKRRANQSSGGVTAFVVETYRWDLLKAPEDQGPGKLWHTERFDG
ncbi:MAG: hypothetical protein AAFX06_34235, partial [Planctomycetota bacterium]